MMYETLMHTLRTFFGIGVLRNVMVGCLGLAAVVFAAMLSPAFRRGLKHLKERGGVLGTAAWIGTGVFKFALIVLMIRFFTTSLSFQANLFAREHGQVTATNRSAVLMKWGYEHHQKELSVSHSRKRIWVTRQLLAKKRGGYSDCYWKDEEEPPQPVNGRRPKIVSTKEDVRIVPVKQKSIVGADVHIMVKSNPRKLGNANYAGYEDTWSFDYTVANPSEYDTLARVSFPLPAQTGLFDDMHLKVDGEDLLESARVSGSALLLEFEMPSNSTSVVEIGYSSRGLEHLRYIPRRMTQIKHYRVTLDVHGVPTDKLDYPIGSMPPAEKLDDLRGDPYRLTWKLDNALTSYDIGLRMPDAEQPEYHFVRLLKQAPGGLIYLVVLLCISRIVVRSPVRPELIAIIGVAYSLHHTFMGRLAEMMTGFAAPFAISAVIIGAVVTWFRLRGDEPLFLRILDSLIFMVIIVLYPLAIADKDSTSFWMQLLHLTSLVYICSLLVCRRRAAPEVPAPSEVVAYGYE